MCTDVNSKIPLRNLKILLILPYFPYDRKNIPTSLFQTSCLSSAEKFLIRLLGSLAFVLYIFKSPYSLELTVLSFETRIFFKIEIKLCVIALGYSFFFSEGRDHKQYDDVGARC